LFMVAGHGWIRAQEAGKFSLKHSDSVWCKKLWCFAFHFIGKICFALFCVACVQPICARF
jgi:hypothetical protein